MKLLGIKHGCSFFGACAFGYPHFLVIQEENEMEIATSEPLITVVIPVFNSEQYIEKAANSVLLQPNADSIELILVDDGSTDSSGALCEQIASGDDRVKVIHKDNQGSQQADAGCFLFRETGFPMRICIRRWKKMAIQAEKTMKQAENRHTGMQIFLDAFLKS